jgi:hypothetical protein
MNLEVSVLTQLPPLAWVAHLRPDGAPLRVFCGANVEHGSHHVVEGCWSGEFDAASLTRAQVVTGTGLVCGNGVVTFVTSTDTLQPLYEYRSSGGAFYSNSLPLLLERAALELLPAYPYYDTDLMSIFLGLRAYRRHIPTNRGPVCLHYHSRLEVDGALRRHALPRSLPPPFPDFRAYVAHLETQSEMLVHNALDSRRKVRYAPLATVSSGYDSACCAVFARRCGCEEAITFMTAREGFADRNDSGSEVGHRLGLGVRELDADAYRQSAALSEIEFVASGYGGDDVIFAAARGVLGQRLLFTGYHGDKVWCVKRHYATDHIARGDPSGGSLLEFRLAAGFQNVPLAFAGCLRHPDIAKIANSAEMAPWRVGGQYDRPIPRRVLESAGVPRGLFGQRKKAASRPYQGMRHTLQPRAFLSAAAYESFTAFLDARAAAGVPSFAASPALAALGRTRPFTSPKVSRLLNRLRLDSLSAFRWRHSKEVGEVSLLFHWAIAMQRVRYRRALSEVPS